MGHFHIFIIWGNDNPFFCTGRIITALLSLFSRRPLYLFCPLHGRAQSPNVIRLEVASLEGFEPCYRRERADNTFLARYTYAANPRIYTGTDENLLYVPPARPLF